MIPIIEKRLGREVLQLSPHLIFMQQDIYQQLNYGLEVLYRGIIIGASGAAHSSRIAFSQNHSSTGCTRSRSAGIVMTTNTATATAHKPSVHRLAADWSPTNPSSECIGEL